jgi:hypothetical protein
MILSCENLIRHNPNILQMFSISSDSLPYIFSSLSISKSLKNIKFLENKTKDIGILMYGNERILNDKQVKENTFELVSKGSLTEDCSLCFNNFLRINMESSCGNCGNAVCLDCLSEWYCHNTSGNIIFPRKIYCPFCVNFPKYNVIKRFNIRNIQMTIARANMDDSVYYAWCKQCNLVKEYCNKSCSEDVPNLKNNFICDDCLSPKENDRRKKCPGCGVLTEKYVGCNHIECPSCETHWCYVCGFSSEFSDEIYSHMWNEHNSIGL